MLCLTMNLHAGQQGEIDRSFYLLINSCHACKVYIETQISILQFNENVRQVHLMKKYTITTSVVELQTIILDYSINLCKLMLYIKVYLFC